MFGLAISVPTTTMNFLDAASKIPQFPAPISRNVSPENLSSPFLRSPESSDARYASPLIRRCRRP